MTSRPQPEAYCQADPVFYDSGTRHSPDDASVFDLTSVPAPDGWRRSERGVWVVHTPQSYRMPQQGWKIHVSGLPDNARQVIGLCWDYCVAQGLPFKFLRSRNVVTTHSLKYAPRSASGKIVTVYPRDERQLREAAEALAELLDGIPGPYILTDLRWGEGPVHIRYGGFVDRYCTGADGAPVHAVERPDGTLVPDDRRPVFTVPDWVEPPDFLTPHLDARRAAGAGQDFPYRVESALHFSNGGGVYRARHHDGRSAVLKEARPHAGFDGRGLDAVTRLEREHASLKSLAGIPGVPELYGYHRVWEHHFLAVQHMPGDTLQTWVARHYPLTKADPSEEQLAAYARRAEVITDRVTQLIEAVHARGFVFGDLHPSNILVDDQDQVSLVDFELSVPTAQAERLGLGNPGFSGTNLTGPDIDRYALAALRVWLLLPLTALAELDPGRTASCADLAERRFGLAPGSLDAARRTLTPGADRLAKVPASLRRPAAVLLDIPEPDWTAVRKSLASAILLSAAPERDDRLFPGDVRQFHTNGSNFAHGAAGVLWALQTTGAGRYPEHEDWLIRSVRDDRALAPGFFDGAHGIAFVLDRFGHRDEALRMMDGAGSAVAGMDDISLYRGLAGIGLNLLDFAVRTGSADHQRRALDVGERACRRGRAADAPLGSGRP
ncbi:serine/threonine protein kinase [Streptomyces spiroverticillatus]